MRRHFSSCRVGTAAAFFLSLWIAAVAGAADNLTLHARLIWGADRDKPSDPNMRTVEPETAGKLAKVFKWQSYYEVSRTNFTVSAGGTKKVVMSPKCDIEVEYLGASNVNVRLYGKGKMVVCKRQTISPGELAVVAGPDKNDTAWFVVLKRERK